MFYQLFVIKLLQGGNCGQDEVYPRVRKSLLLAVLSVCVFAGAAHATVVMDQTENCPICHYEVPVTYVVSWSDYMFADLPSKYDLINSPILGESFIVMCEQCGYAQIAQDFTNLAPTQAEKLQQSDLLKNWQPTSGKVPFAVKLERASETNRILERDDQFWLWFNRLLIFHYRETNQAKAREVAAREVELLKEDTEMPYKQRLYLLGEYSRLSGDIVEARRYFEEARPSTKNRELLTATFAVMFVMGLACLLFLFLFRRRRSSQLVVLLVGCMVISGVIWLYSIMKESDDYVDEIVIERTRLLNRTTNKSMN